MGPTKLGSRRGGRLGFRWGLLPLVMATAVLMVLSFWKGWTQPFEWPGGPSRSAWLYTFLVGAIASHIGRRIFSSAGRTKRTAIFIAATATFFLYPVLLPRHYSQIFQSLAAGWIIASLSRLCVSLGVRPDTRNSATRGAGGQASSRQRRRSSAERMISPYAAGLASSTTRARVPGS